MSIGLPMQGIDGCMYVLKSLPYTTKTNECKKVLPSTVNQFNCRLCKHLPISNLQQQIFVSENINFRDREQERKREK